MVESMSLEGQNKERNVYYYNQALDIKEYRATAIDAFGNFLVTKWYLDNVLVVGSEKGYVYPFEISISAKDKKKVNIKLEA